MRGVIDTMDSLIVGPLCEPLDLEEVKKQRRFSSTSLDTRFDLWIAAAREHFEEQTGRQLITATWEYWLDAFPVDGWIEIPHPPLQSVLSVKYDDADGTEQTMDASEYRVIAPQGELATRGLIEIAAGASWPSTRLQKSAVRIQYKAGYGDTPGDVPAMILYALDMLLGHFHKYGEEFVEAKSALSKLPLGAGMVMEARKFMALPIKKPRYSWATIQILDTVNAWPV